MDIWADQLQAGGAPSIHDEPLNSNYCTHEKMHQINVFIQTCDLSLISISGWMLAGCLSPGSDPRFGVQLQTSTPGAVFLRALGHHSSLRRQLLGHGPDVVRFKPTASADVADASFVGLSGVFVHFPAGQGSGFQS